MILLRSTANADMIEKLTNNYKELKQNLQQNYNSLMTHSKTNFNKHIETFKQNCEEAMKKVPTLSPKTHDEAIKDLMAIQGKTHDTVAQAYKALIEKMDKSFQQTVNQLKFQEPKQGPSPVAAAAAPKKNVPKK